MNIVYLGIGYPIKGDQNIYTDLMKTFIRYGHSVTVVCSDETGIVSKENYTRDTENGINVIRVKTPGNVGNVSLIKKGISTIFEDYFFIRAVKKELSNEKFDLILCSTPPITIINTILYLKRTNNAYVYLMLKDIFPQNAVDLGMIRNNGIVYKYFRSVEKKLYSNCDYIGCMSYANISYIIQHNKISEKKVGLCVNSFDSSVVIEQASRETVHRELNIPNEAVVFLYGGSLGAPQGIDSLVAFLKKQSNYNDRFYIICGKGKEAWKIQNYLSEENPNNILYIPWLEYEKFEALASVCDVGMILLNSRFTIPNFPSRLLTIMRHGMPVFSATDVVTDIGTIAEKNGFGWSCVSSNIDQMCLVADEICKCKDKLHDMGKKARDYFTQYYTTDITYSQIVNNIVLER